MKISPLFSIPFSNASLRRRAGLVSVLVALTCSLAAQAQLRIEIAGVGATQIPMVVSNFAADPSAPENIPQVIRDDLASSGLFRLIDADANPISENTNINFADWKSKGADALVAGSVSRLVDGRYDVRFKLFDTVQRSDLGGLKLSSENNNLRLKGHQIADYVYEKLTGVPGIFSTRIAYVTRQGNQRYELKIADSDGKNEQTALISREPIISPAWSPDGSKLAYVSFETKKPVIYVHTVATAQRIPVANFKGSNSAPSWSPDGRTLAIVLTREGNSQIYLINADGSNVRRLTQSSGIDTEPDFAPDGQTLFFTSDRGGGPQIYRMSVNGGDASRVSFKGDYNISPRISPDGKTLAYVARRGGKFQINVLDLDSGQEQTLTETVKDESPSFAANGKLILYATEIAGRGVLAAVSIDGRVKQRITTQSGDAREPTWGPYLKN